MSALESERVCFDTASDLEAMIMQTSSYPGQNIRTYSAIIAPRDTWADRDGRETRGVQFTLRDPAEAVKLADLLEVVAADLRRIAENDL